MAEIESNVVSKTFSETVLAGERIRIQILNSDGSQKTLICDDNVPTGKQLPTGLSYSGTLENAA